MSNICWQLCLYWICHRHPVLIKPVWVSLLLVKSCAPMAAHLNCLSSSANWANHLEFHAGVVLVKSVKRWFCRWNHWLMSAQQSKVVTWKRSKTASKIKIMQLKSELRLSRLWGENQMVKVDLLSITIGVNSSIKQERSLPSWKRAVSHENSFRL